MENNNQNNNPTQSVPTINPAPVVNQPPINNTPVPEPPKPKKGISELIPKVIAKIKANKKLSILLISFLVMIILIIITGSIYSLIKSSNKKIVIVSPTPVATAEVMLSEESKKSESKLKELKNKILNLDIEQKHLTPPNIDFDISF